MRIATVRVSGPDGTARRATVWRSGPIRATTRTSPFADLQFVVVGLVQAHAQAAAPGVPVQRDADAAVVVLLATADEGVSGAVEGGAGGDGGSASQGARSATSSQPAGYTGRSSAARERPRRSRHERAARNGVPDAARALRDARARARRRASRRRPTPPGVRKVSRPSTWKSGREAARPGAEQHHPPGAVGCLHQVGVAGVLDGTVGAAVGQQRVGRCAFPGAARRAPAGDGDGVAAFGAALGDQQVPPVADAVEVRRLRRTSGRCRTTWGRDPPAPCPSTGSIRAR